MIKLVCSLVGSVFEYFTSMKLFYFNFFFFVFFFSDLICCWYVWIILEIEAEDQAVTADWAKTVWRGSSIVDSRIGGWCWKESCKRKSGISWMGTEFHHQCLKIGALASCFPCWRVKGSVGCSSETCRYCWGCSSEKIAVPNSQRWSLHLIQSLVGWNGSQIRNCWVQSSPWHPTGWRRRQIFETSMSSEEEEVLEILRLAKGSHWIAAPLLDPPHQLLFLPLLKLKHVWTSCKSDTTPNHPTATTVNAYQNQTTCGIVNKLDW